MDEDEKQKKPFDAVSIVLLIIIAGISDISDIATDLIFPVPVIGQVVYLFNSFLISPLTWAAIQGWFIMKVGLGGRTGMITGITNLLGGLGNVANFPPGSETITTVIAIIVANYGSELTVVAGMAGAATAAGTVAPAAGVAAGAETGAAAGAAAAGTGAGAAATGTKTAGVAGAETGATAGKGMSVGAEQAGGTAETEAMTGKRGLEESGTGIPETDEALGEEKNPFEKLRELTEKTPESPYGAKDQYEDEEQNVNIDDDANEVDLKKAA